MTDEYNMQTKLQIERLSHIGGPISLKHFGYFRGVVQKLLVKTRTEVHNSRRNSFLSALNCVASSYFTWFDSPVKANIIFNTKKYLLPLKGTKKQKQSLGDSWSFWNEKIYKNWGIIESLRFIKRFRGIDGLGYELKELLAMILHIDDPLLRLKVLKALQ